MRLKPVRYQSQRCLHFITFSCYRRMKLLDSGDARNAFERELERVRRWYGCYITGYVVMEAGPYLPEMGLPHPCRAFCDRVGRAQELQSPEMRLKPVRYQNQRCLHFITFSCYRRMKLLDSVDARNAFERELERVRRWYGCYITGYVVMPEHVHLLISEPERSELSVVMQMLKQITSRRLRPQDLPHLWQVRYYDFPVWSEKKTVEKLSYMHWNPVRRGLAPRREDWKWSSFVAWAEGAEGQVEIECPATARRRELMCGQPA